MTLHNHILILIRLYAHVSNVELLLKSIEMLEDYFQANQQGLTRWGYGIPKSNLNTNRFLFNTNINNWELKGIREWRY